MKSTCNRNAKVREIKTREEFCPITWRKKHIALVQVNDNTHEISSYNIIYYRPYDKISYEFVSCSSEATLRTYGNYIVTTEIWTSSRNPRKTTTFINYILRSLHYVLLPEDSCYSFNKMWSCDQPDYPIRVHGRDTNAARKKNTNGG